MYTKEGGFLDDIADFDADFFNISDQEARWIDPQHRMLLENSYRALEHAGISPHPLADSNVGVFMGIMGQDYAFLPQLDNEEIINAFQGAGLSHSGGRWAHQLRVWFRRSQCCHRHSQQQFARCVTSGSEKSAGRQLQHGIGGRSERNSCTSKFAVDVESRSVVP